MDRLKHRRPWDRDTLPDLPGTKLENGRPCTAYMVDVAVSERDGVQPANASIAQYRCDDPVAHIKRATARQPACVHQQRCPARKPHERRITLADVDEGNVKMAVPHPANHRPRLGDDP